MKKSKKNEPASEQKKRKMRFFLFLTLCRLGEWDDGDQRRTESNKKSDAKKNKRKSVLVRQEN